MKKIVAIVIALAACISAYFGYQHYQSQELVKSATPLVKEGTLRSKQVTNFVTDPSNATFAEIFKKADATVEKIGELLITLEAQNNQANPAALGAAVSYLKDAQTLARSINKEIRLRFESRQAQNQADDALEDLKSSNEYTRKHARERLSKSIEEMKKNFEQATEHGEELRVALSNLKQSQTSAAKYFPADALLPPETISELETYYAKEEAKQ